jgi:hypothetical protein
MLSQRVAVTKVNGTVIDNRIPRKPARNLAAQKFRFTAASVWARDQMAIPAAKAAYAAAVTKSKPTPYRVAMADYLSAPTVREIDVFDYHGVIGDLISVTAFDDFMVTRVEVIINQFKIQGSKFKSLEKSGTFLTQSDRYQGHGN